jgi:hypothetical protein
LTIFVIATISFRKELRLLLSSLASLNAAGARFELREKRATLDYCAVLTYIFVEILSQRGEGFLENRTALIARRFEIPPKLKMSTDLLGLLGRIM